MRSKYTQKQITDYANRLAKLDLLLFGAITETEEFLKIRFQTPSSMKLKMTTY